MAVNLMEMLKAQVLGQVTGGLSNHLGESEQATKGGLEALLPTVMGGLVKQVSQPGGAESLNKTLDQDDYDGGLLDKFGDMLSSGNTGAVSGLSGGLLSMIFGDKVASIISLVSKVTGLGGKSTSSLLGLALPLIMSFLGKQKRSMGLDANGFASLLNDQKDHIANALPAGIGEELGLGALGIKAPSAAPAPSNQASSPQPAAQASGGGGLMKLLIPLVILGLLGLIAYNFVGGGDKPDPVEASTPDIDLGIDTGVPEVVSQIPGMDAATSTLKESMGSITDILGGITDVDSAKSKLGELEIANESLGSVTGMLDKLPEGMKSGVMSAAAGLLPNITSALDKVMAIPGVGAVLQPVVDSLKEKFGLLGA